MKLKPLIHGVSTFIPGVNKYRVKGTGGTDSSRYCYSVWLRHLVMAKSSGLNPYPRTLAELGPGDSLGIGLAALVSGCDKYLALDVIEHAGIERNLKIFDELVTLFRNKADIPAGDEFSRVKPYLDSYGFPVDILHQDRLERALDESRLARIRDAIIHPQRSASLIQYKVPWDNAGILENGSVDMVLSQAVLEHVVDLRNTYRAMRLWLKPSGYVSHQIDFRCHGTADEWNGHWAYSDFVWKLMQGGKPYLLNREPHSTHIAILKEEGYSLVCDKRVTTQSKLTRGELASRFRFMSDGDMTTSGAFIQAVRTS